MKEKIFLVLLFSIIGISLFGCNNNIENNKNIEQTDKTNYEEQTNKKVTTLATDYEYVTYKADASDYFSNYIPANVLDDDSFSSWVLNDDKYGENEWIKISFDKEIEVNKLYILNGFGDREDKETYKKDNRVKTLEAEFSNGENQTIELEDGSLDEQEIVLEKPVTTSYVKLTIKDVYKGSERYKLTCIGSIGINYPRVNGNDDETTCFTGIYGEYNKIDNKKLSVIDTYIDYKEGLSLDKKVQYLADLIIDENKDLYEDSSIKITENSDGSLNADLTGKSITVYECAQCDISDKFILESNLIQYYYENDDWAKKINFTENGEMISENSYLDKEYLEEAYLNNTYAYRYLTDENYSEDDYYIEPNSDLNSNLNEEDYLDEYNNVNYNVKQAYKKILKNKTINEISSYGFTIDHGLDINEYDDSQLGEYYYPENNTYKMGYIFYVNFLGAPEGGGSASSPYFVDACTGDVYKMDFEFSIEGDPLK